MRVLVCVHGGWFPYIELPLELVLQAVVSRPVLGITLGPSRKAIGTPESRSLLFRLQAADS